MNNKLFILFIYLGVDRYEHGTHREKNAGL